MKPIFAKGDIIHVNKGRRSKDPKKVYTILEVYQERGFYKIKNFDLPARQKLIRFDRQEYYTLFKKSEA